MQGNKGAPTAGVDGVAPRSIVFGVEALLTGCEMISRPAGSFHSGCGRRRSRRLGDELGEDMVVERRYERHRLIPPSACSRPRILGDSDRTGYSSIKPTRRCATSSASSPPTQPTSCTSGESGARRHQHLHRQRERPTPRSRCVPGRDRRVDHHHRRAPLRRIGGRRRHHARPPPEHAPDSARPPAASGRRTNRSGLGTASHRTSPTLSRACRSTTPGSRRPRSHSMFP